MLFLDGYPDSVVWKSRQIAHVKRQILRWQSAPVDEVEEGAYSFGHHIQRHPLAWTSVPLLV